MKRRAWYLQRSFDWLRADGLGRTDDLPQELIAPDGAHGACMELIDLHGATFDSWAYIGILIIEYEGDRPAIAPNFPRPVGGHRHWVRFYRA